MTTIGSEAVRMAIVSVLLRGVQSASAEHEPLLPPLVGWWCHLVSPNSVDLVLVPGRSRAALLRVLVSVSALPVSY